MLRRHELTDAEWGATEPVLPGRRQPAGRQRRPVRRPDRCAVADLPGRSGGWDTKWNRYAMTGAGRLGWWPGGLLQAVFELSNGTAMFAPLTRSLSVSVHWRRQRGRSRPWWAAASWPWSRLAALS